MFTQAPGNIYMASKKSLHGQIFFKTWPPPIDISETFWFCDLSKKSNGPWKNWFFEKKISKKNHYSVKKKSKHRFKKSHTWAQKNRNIGPTTWYHGLYDIISAAGGQRLKGRRYHRPKGWYQTMPAGKCRIAVPRAGHLLGHLPTKKSGTSIFWVSDLPVLSQRPWLFWSLTSRKKFFDFFFPVNSKKNLKNRQKYAPQKIVDFQQKVAKNFAASRAPDKPWKFVFFDRDFDLLNPNFA